ncbi:MAG: SDR family oxidoreductase [Rudaea sp.]|nr:MULTISPECIES: SDR family NAD(P)-dependent oxidoreductase [unclassified Rudaea]MBN8888258.1 SDR family oxidoreductase [Rudaea sp.]MBR0344190.1 SDR family oxidoreductase [Rudaea sp.]
MSTDTRWAVVTGGTSGIGRGIALALARDGWDVAVSYLADDGKPAELAAEIEALGRRAYVSACDAGVAEQVEAFFDGAQQRLHGAPRLLVNNAGVQTWSALLQLGEADWDRVIRTNLKGCFLNTQKAARMMIAAGEGGAIVNIGSGCNKIPFPSLVDYSASKAGIDQFTRSAAMELGPHGITVNCVAPGAIEVERTRLESPDYHEVWSRITPLRRVGTPADVAAAVLFLCSDRASFITGQTLGVDGGVFTRPNWPY